MTKECFDELSMNGLFCDFNAISVRFFAKLRSSETGGGARAQGKIAEI